jgi:hypothetical protein
MKHICYISKHN